MPELQRLPLFPLGIVVFPGEVVNLHIFEPRYKQLIIEAYGEGLSFGIPVLLSNRVSQYGCKVKLLEIFKKYDEGEMDIRIEGEKVFRLESFEVQLKDKLYGGGEIKYTDEVGKYQDSLRERIQEKITALFESLGVKKSLNGYDPFDVGHFIGFSKKEEYDLLKTANKTTQQEMVLTQLDKMIPIVNETQKIKARIGLNGAFRKFDPQDYSGEVDFGEI